MSLEYFKRLEVVSELVGDSGFYRDDTKVIIENNGILISAPADVFDGFKEAYLKHNFKVLINGEVFGG